MKKMVIELSSGITYFVKRTYSLNHRVVHVPDEPVVDWEVPQPPVLAEVFAVPPLLVELPVCEIGEFCQYVHKELEESKESDDPGSGVWQGEPQDLGLETITFLIVVRMSVLP